MYKAKSKSSMFDWHRLLLRRRPQVPKWSKKDPQPIAGVRSEGAHRVRTKNMRHKSPKTSSFDISIFPHH